MHQQQDIEEGKMLVVALIRAFRGQIISLLHDIPSEKLHITFRQVTDETIEQLDKMVTAYLEAHSDCALDVIAFDKQGHQRWALVKV